LFGLHDGEARRLSVTSKTLFVELPDSERHHSGLNSLSQVHTDKRKVVGPVCVSTFSGILVVCF
jgi:hypothetical protein